MGRRHVAWWIIVAAPCFSFAQPPNLPGAPPAILPDASLELAPRPNWSASPRLYVLTTTDGWKLVLRRYEPTGREEPGRIPVILYPDVGMSGAVFDLRGDVSLARYLSAQGFDVWCVDPRGAGMSSRWAPDAPSHGPGRLETWARRLSGRAVPAGGFLSSDQKYAEWRVDDQIDHDVPAIVSFVVHESGSVQIAWVGHGVGGAAMLAHLGKFGQDKRVARVIAIASQLSMAAGERRADFFEKLSDDRKALLASKRASDSPDEKLAEWLFQPDNVDGSIARAVFKSTYEPPATGELAQLVDLAWYGRLRDATGEIDYFDRLAAVRAPCLIIASPRDPIASPADVENLMEGLSGCDRSLLTLDRASGFSVDYGRLDSLVGRRSRMEVYPLLARYLRGEAVGRAR